MGYMKTVFDRYIRSEPKIITASIVESIEGYALYSPLGFVQTYSRRRDAVRGATRRGLILA